MPKFRNRELISGTSHAANRRLSDAENRRGMVAEVPLAADAGPSDY
jgi:hypothetical protein